MKEAHEEAWRWRVLCDAVEALSQLTQEDLADELTREKLHRLKSLIEMNLKVSVK